MNRPGKPRRQFRAKEIEAFFRQCEAPEGAETEPDRDEHLTIIDESRRRGVREVRTLDQAPGAAAEGQTRAK